MEKNVQHFSPRHINCEQGSSCEQHLEWLENIQTFKIQAREVSEGSLVVGIKTHNSDTLGDHGRAKDIGSGYMASGFHSPCWLQRTPENFNRGSHDPSNTWKEVSWVAEQGRLVTRGDRWHRTQVMPMVTGRKKPDFQKTSPRNRWKDFLIHCTVRPKNSDSS